MSASYPGSVKTFTSRNAGDTIQPSHVNDLQDEVNALETSLLSSFTTTFPLTSGQIAFPATQSASANANTLDDYEEGTWTPGIAFGGGATGVTYGTQTGTYVKVGRLVQFQGRITLTSKGSSTGVATITGLPFTSTTTTSNFAGGVTVYWGTLTSSAVVVSGHVACKATTVAIFIATAAATSLSQMQNTDVANTTDLIFGGSYYAAA